jgi:MraZ protein
MFVGEFDHTLDNKGRLTIPSKFREELAGGLVVTRGFDKGSLLVYPRAEWDVLAEKITSLPATNRKARMLSRFLFSQATDAIPDRQGRVLIPQNLRKYAGIESESLVIGMHNWVEIWNPGKWREVEAEFEENIDDIAAQFEELGI